MKMEGDGMSQLALADPGVGIIADVRKYSDLDSQHRGSPQSTKWGCFANNPRPGVIRLTRHMSGDLSVEISCADSIDQRSKTSARLPQRPSSWLQDPAGPRLAIASPASGFQEGGQRRTRRHFDLTIRTRWLNQRRRGSRWRRPASRCGAA